VDRDPAFAAVGKDERLAPNLADRHDLADQRARRGRAERYRHRRLDQCALMLDPPAAGGDLAGVRPVVDAPLAARQEFEMLDGVGDVDGRAVDPGLLERFVEDRARGPDERPPGKILLVARLFADEQDRRVERAFAEHRLGRIFVEIATGAVARFLQKRFPRGAKVAARLDPALRFERFLQTFNRNIGHRRCNE